MNEETKIGQAAYAQTVIDEVRNAIMNGTSKKAIDKMNKNNAECRAFENDKEFQEDLKRDLVNNEGAVCYRHSIWPFSIWSKDYKMIRKIKTHRKYLEKIGFIILNHYDGDVSVGLQKLDVLSSSE